MDGVINNIIFNLSSLEKKHPSLSTYSFGPEISERLNFDLSQTIPCLTNIIRKYNNIYDMKLVY
jgi:hypothetical protein